MDYIVQLLLVWLWTAVAGATTYHTAVPPPNPYSSLAVTYCQPSGRSEVWVRPELPAIVTVHELTHALDCADDGAINSSLFAVPDHSGPFACPDCNSQVERQAVWVHTHVQDSYPALLAWARVRAAVWGPGGGLRAGRVP